MFSRSMVDGPDLIGPQAPRSVKRKMTLITLAGTLALVGVVSGAYYYAMRPVTLHIAVGPQNSDDLRVIQALSQAFSREHSYVRLRPVLTDGAIASAAALSEGKVDLAVIRGDLEVPKNAQAVATLRKNVAVLWVPPAAKSGKSGSKASSRNSKVTKITKVGQLAGHRVGVIGRTQANVNLLKIILQQYGVDPAKVDIVQFSPTEILDAVKSQKADAFLAAGPVTSKITIEAIAASARDGSAPIFLPIDTAEAIAANHPAYESTEVPAGAFGGSPARPDDDIKTIGFSHHIVARRSISETTIAALTRQLFAIRRTVMAEFPLAAKIETPDTDKDAVIPVHPGAAAFVDGEEKSFSDRYSDYIWWTLMGLSALGSAGAWFASHLRKDERGNNISLRGRLLIMLATARHSDSVDELDELQAEADSILRDTLTSFENGAIQEGALTAFNIALEQFHNAVADRKAWLAIMPQNLSRAGVQLRSSGAL